MPLLLPSWHWATTRCTAASSATSHCTTRHDGSRSSHSAKLKDEEADKELEAALGIITEPVTGTTDPVPADLDLDDSWGLAAHAGFDYLINDHWGINASIWYIEIESDATIETDLADVKFDVELDPWVYMIGVSYKF